MKNLLLLLAATAALISCSVSDECRSDPQCTFETFKKLLIKGDCEGASEFLCPGTEERFWEVFPEGWCSDMGMAIQSVSGWKITDEGLQTRKDRWPNKVERWKEVRMEVEGENMIFGYDDVYFGFLLIEGKWLIVFDGVESECANGLRNS